MKDIELYERLLDRTPNLEYSGGSGSIYRASAYELSPQDFLEFAEEDISTPNSTKALVNSVSNLKRATECQLDIFIDFLELTKLTKKKRTSYGEKLEFIENMGIISPRSLRKLNSIRNKLEHEYAIPGISEVELYFDIAGAFVSTIEGYIHMIANQSASEWNFRDDREAYGFISEYLTEPPRLEFRFGVAKEEGHYEFLASQCFKTFTWAFRIHLILCRATVHQDPLKIAKELKKIDPNQTCHTTPAITPR